MDLLKYLNSIGKKEYIRKNYNLDNIKQSLNYLNSPHKKLKNIIHITGTNGKGSVAIYTARILFSLGYNVGLYISPHIYKINERIQYNDEQITDNILSKYLTLIYKILPKKVFYKLTYFELLTCIMFLYFADIQPDFVILEVGLGGKLDATNVIDYSIISCITSIALDHTEILGNTKFQILKDKSAIIKKNSVFICGDIEDNLRKYLKNLCKKLSTKFLYVKKSLIKNLKLNFDKWETKWKYKNFDFMIPVCSLVQPYNVLLSIKIIEEIYNLGYIKKVDYEKIQKLVAKEVIPFRMQKLYYKKLNIVIDGAHNFSAIKNFVATIQKSKLKNLFICFTMMKEKDYKSAIKILALLKDRIERFIVYNLNIPRNQKLQILYSEAKKYFGEKVLKFNNKKNLLNYLTNFCKNKKIFFVGSFYVSKILGDKIE
ncbi:MAG: bifunctional folylpolyglutamate synthase/dihydrofolate synthase [Endomicrobiia bacterium]